MENLPLYISTVFIITVLVSIALFCKATGYARPFIVTLLLWIAFQTLLSLTGFYTQRNAVPPRFPLLLAPPIILFIILFTTTKGKAFIHSLNIEILTIFSIIRIPVELVLIGLFAHSAIPQVMTFEGRNFDIISGITAPVIYYFAFVRKNINTNIVLAWNFICLGLVLNVVFYAVFSIPGPVQKFAFNQPNVAVAYFPFVLLPSCLVPLVILSHLASIRQLLKKKPTVIQ